MEIPHLCLLIFRSICFVFYNPLPIAVKKMDKGVFDLRGASSSTLIFIFVITFIITFSLKNHYQISYVGLCEDIRPLCK